MRIHREKAIIRYSSGESKILKAKEIGESSTSSSVEQGDVEMQSLELSQEGTKHVSIKEFFINKPTDTDILKRVAEEPCSSKDTESVMTVQDQIVKAETLWALKTASENLSFRASDGIPQLFQKMFPDSTIAQHITMSQTKVAYMIGHGLGPYFQQQTIDDILTS